MTAALPRAVQSAVEQAILTAATLLMDHGSVAELRIPKAGRHGTISGYFNDPAALARAAVQLNAAQLPGIYITLNPCNPALLARAVNRIRYRADLTTQDQDILRRRWLLIDCDPVRPSGISSSDQEHGRAIATACGIWDDLRSIGWPDPVVCDSGNGAHLLYRLDLANTPAVTQSIKATLAGIAQHSAPDAWTARRWRSFEVARIADICAEKEEGLVWRVDR